MADDRDRAIRDYAVLTPQVVHPGIIKPEVEAVNFELKPVMFQMLQIVGQFNGLPNKDPHLHLKLFLENELADKFLMKYFPPTKNAKLRNEITSFHQLEDESLYEAWERFKELLRRCPHHGIPCCIQLETFYNGLNPSTRLMVDASANGALLSKSYTESYEILERIANNNYQGTAGVHNIDAITVLSAQVTSLINMVKAMTSAPATVKQVVELSCVYCGEEHDFDNCPRNPALVNYVGNFNRQPQNNPYSNTYNPGWKQHPNFSWSSQNRNAPALNGQNRNTQPSGFHQQTTATSEGIQPEHAEKEAATPVATTYAKPNKQSLVPPAATQQFRHPPHFLQRFQKQKQDKQFSKILKVLKQLHINIPFVEALEQMPNYVKFLKDILARKRRLREFETVALTQESSHMLQSKIPTKVKDPRSFTIHCSIRTRECRPTAVTLQLADRSHAYLEGKIEDVLVKVDKFIFPVDFIVLDFEADKEVPIILGSPFLATGNTLIDVQKGELTMRVNDQQVTFNVLEAMKNPNEVEDCNFLSVVDFVVADRMDRCCSNEINKVTTFEDLEEKDVAANQIDWKEDKQSDRHNKFIEHLNLSDREVKITLPYIESPPSFELKLLPSHLKYVYLGQNNTLPVIISSTLNAG
ncbi:hypothetical protein KPL71_017596 [Citrus sinensis]|uniref:Uncharacterized protein n=1 Tax=Citrus sinensis TaxID=2711 RepID=A0ACB8JT97_CITSI|nr:hypothetical protein KPL71_017596 [Citrus sinensis]